MLRAKFVSTRSGRIGTLLFVLFALALVIPTSVPAFTIVPATPGAEITDEQPEDTTGEIAPELPAPDLPTLNAQGWSFDLDSNLNMDLSTVPTQTAVYIIRREVTTLETAEKLVESLGIDADLVDAAAAPFDSGADLPECRLHELAHAVLLNGRNHKIFRFVLLQHQPLRIDVIARMSPVAFGIQVTDEEPFLKP